MDYKYPEHYDTDSVYDDKTNSWIYTYKPKFLNRIDAEQSRQAIKQYLNSLYGTMVKENKDMRIKDFIVLHSDTQPLMIKKDSITSLSRLADGTARVETTNQIWITDDKYQDVVKKLFEV